MKLIFLIADIFQCFFAPVCLVVIFCNEKNYWAAVGFGLVGVSLLRDTVTIIREYCHSREYERQNNL